MSTTDSSIIDTKKTENETQTVNNIGKQILTYTKSIVYSILILLLIIFIGTSILYSCKVAQSNILPTDILCSPYNDTPFSMIPEIKNININVTNINDIQQSEKIQFLYKNNNKNIIIDNLKKMSTNLKVKPIIMYFITILENLLCFIYTSLNIYLNFLNSSFSESVIIFGTPFITLLYLSFIYLLSWGYLIVLFFTKMFWIFRINTNNSDKKSEAKTTDYFKKVSFLTSNGIMSIITACILLCFMLFFITVVFPILIFVSLIYCFLSIVTMTASRVVGGKDYTVINALTDVFYYKKSLLSYIMSFMVVSKAFNIFGSNGGSICLLIILLIYFKIIKIPLFNDPELDLTKFSELTDYNIPEKTCMGVSSDDIEIDKPLQKISKQINKIKKPKQELNINRDVELSPLPNMDLIPIQNNISNVELTSPNDLSNNEDIELSPLSNSELTPISIPELSPLSNVELTSPDDLSNNEDISPISIPELLPLPNSELTPKNKIEPEIIPTKITKIKTKK